jgi:hypothetical protein
MAKKPKEPLMVPYVECEGVREYITYSGSWGQEDHDTFYHRFPIRDSLPQKWEPATEFEDTLVLVDTERGQSAARLVVHSVTNGNRYQMFFADFVKMLKQIDMHKGIFTGRFIPCKKGSNYAIQWLGKPND